MTIDETKYIFQKAIAYLEDEPIAQPVVEAMQVAIVALNEKEERQNPKRLTLEELNQMYGQPVWVEHYNGGEWVTVHWNFSKCISTAYRATLDESAYGKEWWAYPYKIENSEKPKESVCGWARTLN